MAEYVAHGQAVRPQVRDPVRQQALTERFLAAAVEDLRELMLRLRADLDPALRAARPFRGKASYPLGQCLEITTAVQRRLEAVEPAGLPAPAARGLLALRAFVAAGGEIRRAWGDLRGLYFQNALIVGTLYVDVANDTVVITKPPVEIMPFADADLRPLGDYAHYARIAGRYWNRRLLPNHVLPGLAPYLPLIEIAPSGVLRVGPLNPYMLSLTLAEGFAPSARALAASALAPEAFESLRLALHGAPFAVAGSPEEGRAAALAACGSARADSAADFNGVMAAAAEANRRLGRILALPKDAPLRA